MVPKREKKRQSIGLWFWIWRKFYFLNSKGYSIFGAEISKNVISYLKKKLKRKNIKNIKLLHINTKMKNYLLKIIFLTQ